MNQARFRLILTPVKGARSGDKAANPTCGLALTCSERQMGKWRHQPAFWGCAAF